MANITNKTLKYFILLLLVVVPLYSLGLSNHGLWSADEPRVAEIGREMALTGNWAVPMLNEKPFLEEPPLYYGSLALAFRTLGASDRVARIPSALFAFAGVLAVFLTANLLFGPRVALLSGLILVTTGEYFRVAHWVIVDSALTFFVISAMGLFIAGYHSEPGKRKLLRYLLLYVACTLAFYTKGFIGIVLPGLSILAFLAIERNLKELIKMKLWLGVLIFLGMTSPWFLALWHQGGAEYLKVFFLHNHLQRFLPASMAAGISGAVSGHHHPFYYYLTEFPSGFLPWSLLLVPALYLAFSKAGKAHDALFDKGRLFALCWFFAGLIFLSIASTKRTLYLMPLFAPVAMLTALYIDYTMDCIQIPHLLDRIGKVFMWAFNVVLFVIGLGLTPAYFYLRHVYLPDAPARLPVSTFVLSVLLMAFALGAMGYLLRGNMRKYWISINVPVISMFAFTLLVVVPILDQHKSFVPFCRQITTSVPGNSSFYAYKADETARGAVPFYTGRHPIEIEELGSDILKGEKPFYIMVRDRKRKLERELLATGRLSIVAKQEMGTDRAMVLLSNGAVQDTVTMEDPISKNKRGKSVEAAAPLSDLAGSPQKFTSGRLQ